MNEAIRLDSNSLVGKRVLIKYGEHKDSYTDSVNSDESGILVEETDDSYILKDDQGRIIKAPKNCNHAKVVCLEGEND